MKPSEMFALRMCLTSFPETDSFDDVLAKLDMQSNDVIVWEPFKSFTTHDLSEYILNSVIQIESQFFPLHELITVIDKDTVKGIFFNLVGRPAFSDELTRLCSLLDTDFSFQLPEKIGDALNLLHIKSNK